MPNFSGLWTERQQMQAAGASTWPAVPGAPTIGTATAGAGSASVAFTAPSYTGYPAGITSYTATSSPGGFTGTGASSPITVSGLTNGTAYTFTVTATNATGTGPASAASNSVTPVANYIEDVFSPYIYTGNGLTQVINNGIQLGSENYGSVQFTTTGSSLLSSQTLTIGSGDFTFECWVNFTSSASSADATLFSSTGTSTGRVTIRISNGVLQIGQLGVAWDNSASVQTWTIGTWYHVAIVRSSGTLTFYRNGSSIGSGSNSVNYVTTSGTEIGSLEPSYSGYDFPGYLSQMRISTIAVYTSTFTPPTSPLTALPSTIMLTCQGSSANAGSTPMSFTASSVTFSSSSPFTIVAGYGGMVWTKQRGQVQDHLLCDTTRGNTKYLSSNLTDAEGTSSTRITNFNTNGYSLGTGAINGSTNTFVSWTFRKQPKFFDIVTYTGDGTTPRNIAHSLGSVPGCIIVKCTSNITNWVVYHRSLSNTSVMVLNDTAAVYTGQSEWASTTPTSTQFTVGSTSNVNQNGLTYVAYIFAHDAGGFGLTGTDNVITCGMYTKGTDAYVNLGWEPQWVMVKPTNVAGQSWFIQDNMRGMPATSGANQCLFANSSSAESGVGTFNIDATGFTPTGFANGTQIIYIAIRRGPMKVPTDGTTVFSPVLHNGNGSTNFSAGFPPSLVISGSRDGAAYQQYFYDRLRGIGNPPTGGALPFVSSPTTSAEANTGSYFYIGQTGFGVNTSWSTSDVLWMFQRAPSFFDEVCYTGTGSTTTITHNLGVTPELVITKSRSQALGWVVWTTGLTNTNYWIRLDDTMAQSNSPVGYGGTFSASNYTIANTGPYDALNNSGSTYVAYLFATCAGVSKVGSYTGTGTLTTINCGFTGGARYVLIKRIDSTSNWFVWDTARGMVAGTDPSLSLNSTAAESNANSVYTIATGFQLLASPSADVNTNGGSYIYLAVA